MAPKVGFELTATNEGLLAVLQESKDAIKAMTSDVGGALTSINAAFSSLVGIGTAVAAVFEGGTLFKAAIAATVELARDSIDLGMQLGIGASRASDLRVAMASVGITQEQVARGIGAVTRALNTHEAAFATVGVATRTASGGYRDTLSILTDSMTALSKYSEGTNRNIEAVRLFGRAWQEIAPLVRLTNDEIDEGTARAKALGLEVGVEDVQHFLAYQRSMAAVDDTYRAMANSISKVLMPELTALGNWFSNDGQNKVGLVGDAIRGVLVRIEDFGLSARSTFADMSTGVEVMAKDFTRLGNVISHAAKGDLKGAAAAWNQGFTEIQQLWKAHDDAINADIAATAARIEAMFNIEHKPIPPSGNQDSDSPDPKKSRMGEWEAQLSEKKAAEAKSLSDSDDYHEFSKAQELAFWQHILATTKTNATEKAELEKTINNLIVGIRRDGYEAELADLKTQESALGKNYAAQLSLAEEYAAKVAKAFGTESKQYAEASKAIVEIKKAETAQLLELDKIRETAAQGLALAHVDMEEQRAQQDLSLHKISDAQMLADEKSFEDQRFAIKVAALEREKSLIDPKRDPAAFAKANAEIEALATAHAQKLFQIDQQLTMKQLFDWKSFFDSVQSAFAQNFAKMAEGTESFAQGIRSIFLQVGDAIIGQFALIAAKWATTQIANLVLGRTTAAGIIQGYAATAGAAGVASWAGAPWPVDLGAPGFGAAMYADAMAYDFASLRGFDVPAGLMPKVQLHPKETVLPADIAETYRENAPGARRGGGDIHIHSHSIVGDGADFHRVVMDNKGAIAKALRSYARTGR